MEHKGDIGDLKKKTPAELTHEVGYRSARSGTKISKVMQDQLRRNADLKEEFLKGAEAGQRERQEADRGRK